VASEHVGQANTGLGTVDPARLGHAQIPVVRITADGNIEKPMRIESVEDNVRNIMNPQCESSVCYGVSGLGHETFDGRG